MIEGPSALLSDEAQSDLAECVTVALVRAVTDGLRGTEVAQVIVDEMHTRGHMPKATVLSVRSVGPRIEITMRVAPEIMLSDLVLAFDWTMQS